MNILFQITLARITLLLTLVQKFLLVRITICSQAHSHKIIIEKHELPCWDVVVTPPLPRDGGTARTAIQVHAVNLIELGYGKDSSPFRISHEWLVPPPPTRRTSIDGYPRVASYDMLNEQLHNCNPVKYG